MATGGAIIVQDDDRLSATGNIRGDSIGTLSLAQGANALSAEGHANIVGNATLYPGDTLLGFGIVRGWISPTPTRNSWTQLNA